MSPSTATCRGFTHPVILLIKHSIQPAFRRTLFTTARTPNVRTSNTRSAIRLFTTAKPLKGQSGAKLSPKIVKAVSVAAPGPSTAYAQKLALNPHGTVLYEGSPQRVFVFSSFTAGFVCMGAAGLNAYYNVFNVPPGVPEWTAYAFGSVGVMLAILGMNFALKPSGIVRTIKILPMPATAAAPKTKTTYHAPSKVQVEVVSRRLTPIPGFPLKTEVVEPQDIVLKARMYDPKPPPSQIEQLQMRQEWAERKKALKEYDDEHRMTVPFRDAKWALSTIFESIRRGLTGEGFVPIEIKGSKYKLDITNGYIYEQGKALDRVARIEIDETEKAPLLMKKT